MVAGQDIESANGTGPNENIAAATRQLIASLPPWPTRAEVERIKGAIRALEWSIRDKHPRHMQLLELSDLLTSIADALK